jgi:hypothetical protein
MGHAAWGCLLSTFLTVASVILAPLLAAELTGLVDWVTPKVVESAVRPLSPSQKTIRREELLAELSHYDGMRLVKLGKALSCWVGMRRIAHVRNRSLGHRTPEDLVDDLLRFGIVVLERPWRVRALLSLFPLVLFLWAVSIFGYLRVAAVTMSLVPFSVLVFVPMVDGVDNTSRRLVVRLQRRLQNRRRARAAGKENPLDAQSPTIDETQREQGEYRGLGTEL